MNTLFGGLVSLNDVQYPRYRVAFKFRKLQKSLYLEYGTVGMLSEAMHLTGLQGLRDNDVVPLSQLSSVLSELYGAIRASRPVLKPGQLQQAQDMAYNWLQLAYKTGCGEEIVATHLKITLCLFLGSKVSDKARFIFGQLANANGAIVTDGLRLFVRILKQLAHALQENVYDEFSSLDKVFQDCLIFVRDSEDVEEEQLDGGIRRQWLSQFEFTKLLTSSPPPPFFSWLLLWFALPEYEKVVHSVRCSVCTRKPIVCFRYQCTQCHNYHMCQMCFLKGRSSDHHQVSHKVLEFSNKGHKSSRSWHHRLLGLPHRGAAMGGRVVTDEKRLFSFRPDSRVSRSSNSNEETDIAVTAVNDMISNSQMSPVLNGADREGSHKPAIVRIGSDGKPAFKEKKAPSEEPAAHTLQTSPARRVSLTSGSSSPDSLSFAGGFDGPRGSQSSGSVGPPETKLKTTTSNGTTETNTMGTKKKDLTAINKHLSMEVDRILMDLPPASPNVPSSAPPNHTRKFKLTPNHHDNDALDSNLRGIQKEEQQLQEQVSQLTDKREKLSHELQDFMSQVHQMQVGFQTLGHGSRHTRSWGRLTSPPSFHTRSDSAPIQSPSPTSSSPDNSLPPLTETEISPEPAAIVARPMPSHDPDRCRPHVYSPDLATPPYHDPLSEYTGGHEDIPHPKTDHRLSVAW